MVIRWTDDDRRELAELCRIHDRMMAEARASQLVPKSDVEEELVFKVLEDATPPAPEPEPEPFDEAQSDVLARVIAMVQDREHDEREKAIAPLKIEIAELRGQVSALLMLVRQKECKSANVIDLPDWRKRDVA
jgi:hypothetical protein